MINCWQDLYKRLFDFSIRCIKKVSLLSPSLANRELSSQLIRSSSSPAANYIEAIEATSRKDFIYRLKVSRKEIKESVHWLNMLSELNGRRPSFEDEIKEGGELIKILSRAILTSEQGPKMTNVK